MIVWHGKEFELMVKSEMAKRLPLAGAVVVGEVKRLLGVQGRPSVASMKQGSRVTRSKPGEPPRWQTKTLRKSITQESVSNTEERVGTNVKYAKWLEGGTPNMAARPFLRPGLAKSKKKIIAILTKPIK
jgi:HK97 gp10 family phage protein